MALLGEVEVQRATTTSPGRFEVLYDVLEQGQRSEDGDFLLFVGLDAIFLRGNKIEERLGTSIKRMKLPLLVPRRSLLTIALVEDGEEEVAMVQGTVLNRVIQFGYLRTVE